MASKYFQVCREWLVDESGVVPKLTKELNKCAFAAISITSKDTYVRISRALNHDIIELYENDISNKQNQIEVNKPRPLIISPTDSTAKPAVAYKELKTFEIFSQGMWSFEVSIDRLGTSIFIIARYRNEDVRDAKDNTLDLILEIDKALARENLMPIEIPDYFLWQFKKDDMGWNHFFE